jgi:autoinducer 2-degrading protein
MYIVHVFLEVKSECLDEFIALALDDASNSINEPGVARFDVIQQADDPTRFVLVEVYRSEEDTVKHRQTAHFARWRDSVDAMLAAPRTRIVYKNVYPADQDWG